MPRKPTGKPRGRPLKNAFSTDGSPNLTVLQSRSALIEAAAYHWETANWSWAPSTYVARRAGVTDRAIRKWRELPEYNRAIEIELGKIGAEEIRRRWAEEKANPLPIRATRFLREAGGKTTIILPPGQSTYPRLDDIDAASQDEPWGTGREE
jgi:hypothetical protein